LAEVFRKTSGLVDLVRAALAPLAGRISVAFIFGSIAKGAETASSDVDLYVIGDAGFAEVVGILSGLRERLGREISPVVATRKDFRAQRKSKERFVTRVLGEPKLFVIGSADDLE
jgi:predicted nucleotidyltransferase